MPYDNGETTKPGRPRPDGRERVVGDPRIREIRRKIDAGEALTQEEKNFYGKSMIGVPGKGEAGMAKIIGSDAAKLPSSARSKIAMKELDSVPTGVSAPEAKIGTQFMSRLGQLVETDKKKLKTPLPGLKKRK